MSKLLTRDDLIAAGVSAAILPVFDRLWPSGMEITADNAAKAARTGIDIYLVAQQILPGEAWTAYIQQEQGLIAAHMAAIQAEQQDRNGTIATARLAIVDVMAAAKTQLDADIASTSTDPVVLTAWETNSEMVLGPFKLALATVNAGIATFQAALNTALANSGANIAALDAQLEANKVTAIVAIIDALPEQPPEA